MDEECTSRTVHLNGGPLHDQWYTIPADRDHIHILQAKVSFVEAMRLREDNEPVPMVEGIYSQVFREPGEFEWDGFISHD